ncbi:DUF4339 domain-containing protein [Microcoleus sp. AT9_B5]
MKSVRRSTQPTPEVPQWYVFRSGEAKGPYTKLQLWEIQEITARTKVRRGEAEWQRAGEIPELASYLPHSKIRQLNNSLSKKFSATVTQSARKAPRNSTKLNGLRG